MTNPFDDDDHKFFVLINDEGQHSLWPEHLDVPAGWVHVGPHGDRTTCLTWIDAHWTDMRPLSLVRDMGRQELFSAQDTVHLSLPFPRES